MKQNDLNYIIDTLEKIRDETHQNNIMLKQICKVVNMYLRNHNKENEDDFVRNVLANIVSGGIDINKIIKRQWK